MQLLYFFGMLCLLTGVWNVTPGDPFTNDLDVDPNQFYKNISLRTKLTVFNNCNETSTNNIKQTQHMNSMPLLVKIAQWKHIDAQTHETRHWYHTAGSSMGAGWELDRILCIGYIRPRVDTVPIEAYHSETKGIWTNTLQIQSKSLPIGNNQWKYDGILFHAYNSSTNSNLLKPVWRYWNRIGYGTEDVSEPRRSLLRMGNIVEDNLPGWVLDRVIFYAFPPDLNITGF